MGNENDPQGLSVHDIADNPTDDTARAELEEADKAAINKISDVFSMDEALALFNEHLAQHQDKLVDNVLNVLINEKKQWRTEDSVQHALDYAAESIETLKSTKAEKEQS